MVETDYLPAHAWLNVILMQTDSHDIGYFFTLNETVYMCVGYYCGVLFVLRGEELLVKTHYTTSILQQGALWGYNCALAANDHEGANAFIT